MDRYAMLLAPSANRVYADGAARLARAELAAFASAGVLDAMIDDIAEAELGAVPYLTFTAAPRSDAPRSAASRSDASRSAGGATASPGQAAGPGVADEPPPVADGSGLSARDVAYLSNLSSAYALFARTGAPAGPELLRPVTMTPLARYDSDLITIPKYAGKTNEQFTRLLLNLTVLASAAAPRMLDAQLVVCDPLCGRGTTLNQALMYGYDALGIEIDGKDVEAYSAFLRTWLKRKRLKHTAELVPVRRERKLVARRLEVSLAPSKDDYQAGAVQRVTVLHADSTRLAGLLRGNVADVLIADTPYGVAHGSHTEDGGLSRRPLDLLERAVPQWVALLRPGGALGLSWNLKVARRELAEDILIANGLEIVGYPDLVHRVDQAIERDVVVARKRG